MLVPGAAVVRACGFGRDALERFVIAVAIGRIGFALATLAAVTAFGTPLSLLWAGAGVVAFALARRRGPPPAQRGATHIDVALVVLSSAAAALLAHAVVARSGLRDASGALVFFGRDSAFDPIVYAAASQRLLLSGLPLTHPFAAGSFATGQYIHLMLPAALQALARIDIADVAFRALPLFDLASAGIAAGCVARALGGGAIAIATAPLWLLLAAEPAFLVPPLAPLFGGVGRRIDTWAFFGPYLLAFNPIAPAIHALFAAFLLLLGAPARRAAASAAGVLVGSLFETKVFLWAPVMGGLACAALWRPPRAASAFLRWTLGVALLVSAPSLVEKALASARYAGVEEIGFRFCPGCLPRYLIGTSWLGQDVSFASFRNFQLAQIAIPRVLADAAITSVITIAVALGARAIALPSLARAAFGRDPEAAASEIAVQRWMLAASAFGIAGTCAVVVAPHYLNGAQFAWIACYGLAPFVALTVGRWVAARRALALAITVFLSVPSSLDILLRLGWGAPRSLAVSADEQQLCAELARVAKPGDSVLEPSMLADADVPSPLPWLAGRPSYLSLLSTIQTLPQSEQEQRLHDVAAVFAESDRGNAARAIAESGVAFVYAPAKWPLRFDPSGLLEPVARNAGGVVYRVVR